MNISKVISAINSDLRRKILKILSKHPMTVMEVFEELKKSRLTVKYRETVYRALEKLLEAGLVEKYYEREKGLCYRIIVKRVIIDLTEGKVELRNE